MDAEFLICKIKTDARRATATLELDGAPPLVLALDVYLGATLREGAVIGAAIIEELRRADERHRCRQKAWKSISQRPRSRAELERKLRGAKFPPALISATLDDLEARGFLNDQQYAQRLVEERKRQGRGGPNLLRQELRARGLKDNVASQALAPVATRESQRAAAADLFNKWNRRSKPDDPAKRRLAAASFLARRGFDSDIVWEVVRSGLRVDED